MGSGDEYVATSVSIRGEWLEAGSVTHVSWMRDGEQDGIVKVTRLTRYALVTIRRREGELSVFIHDHTWLPGSSIVFSWFSELVDDKLEIARLLFFEQCSERNEAGL